MVVGGFMTARCHEPDDIALATTPTGPPPAGIRVVGQPGRRRRVIGDRFGFGPARATSDICQGAFAPDGVDVALLARFFERFADQAVSVTRHLDYIVTGALPGRAT